MRRNLAILGTGVMGAFVVVAGIAAATAFGSFEVRGPVVAHGHSPRHVPWKIKTQRDGADRADFAFYVGREWYGMQFTLPISRAFVFTADAGSDAGPEHESDLSGITARRVFTVVVVMNKGHALRIHPRLAPKQVRDRFAYLGHLRFINRFYATDRRPRIVKAFDGKGRVLARRHSNRGLFDAALP